MDDRKHSTTQDTRHTDECTGGVGGGVDVTGRPAKGTQLLHTLEAGSDALAAEGVAAADGERIVQQLEAERALELSTRNSDINLIDLYFRSHLWPRGPCSLSSFSFLSITHLPRGGRALLYEICVQCMEMRVGACSLIHG